MCSASSAHIQAHLPFSLAIGRYGATLITKGEIDFKALMTAMMALMLSAIGLGNALLGLGDQKEGILAAKVRPSNDRPARYPAPS